MHSGQDPCRHAEYSVQTEVFRTHTLDTALHCMVEYHSPGGFSEFAIASTITSRHPAPLHTRSQITRICLAHQMDPARHVHQSPSSKGSGSARIVDRARPPFKTATWRVIPCRPGCPPLDDAVWLASPAAEPTSWPPTALPDLTHASRMHGMHTEHRLRKGWMGCTPAAGLLGVDSPAKAAYPRSLRSRLLASRREG